MIYTYACSFCLDQMPSQGGPEETCNNCKIPSVCLKCIDGGLCPDCVRKIVTSDRAVDLVVLEETPETLYFFGESTIELNGVVVDEIPESSPFSRIKPTE